MTIPSPISHMILTPYHKIPKIRRIMLRNGLLATFLAFAATVSATGEFSVVHYPRSLSFQGHDQLRASTLREVYSAAVGFSTSHFSNWNGIYIEDPFNLARAIATVAVEGFADIDYGTGHQFPLKNDEDESDTYLALRHRILERYPDNDDNILRVDLTSGLADLKESPLLKKFANEIDVKYEGTTYSLKTSVEEDNQFLTEINLLTEIAGLIEKHSPSDNAAPNIFWFRLGGLLPLVDLYGENSTKVNDARLLLKGAILDLNKSLQKAYNGQVLVSVINAEPVHSRHTRSILQAAKQPEVKADEADNLNLAKNYSTDYPVIFNIILWFGVAMVFSLLAICLAIATMDPGRDSIIYRMTSTRLKKD